MAPPWPPFNNAGSDSKYLHYFPVIAYVMSSGVHLTDSAYDGHKTSQAIKGAPLESLFAQFCLHSLWFGNCNIRGMYQNN